MRQPPPAQGVGQAGRWSRLKQLFDAALELAEAERPTFLDAECAGDVALRDELETLLAAHRASAGFMDRPALERLADTVGLGVRPDPALPAGTRLGPYELTELLGQGGMASVYAARDTRLDREVAIKVLPSHMAARPSRVQLFELEARAASALNHPNIVTVHDVGRFEAHSYIVMERVRGETLRAALAQGPLPAGRVLHVAAQLGAGLARAHAAGIVHRDLKPENVMLAPEEQAKILDFGVAKLDLAPTPPAAEVSQALPAGTSTTTAGVLGTLGYMSPEQARGADVDFRSDQFALGAILYEMASGRRAFPGQWPWEVMDAVLGHTPKMPAQGSDLPEEFWRLVRRCLSKERAGRFASTDELAEATARLLRTWSRGPGPSPRHRRFLAPAAGLLGVALVLGSVGRRPQPGELESVAVLRFASAAAAENEPLADGMTESVIRRLSPVTGSRVISRNAVFGLPRDIDPREAGRRLNVQGVLVARLTEQRQRVSVDARLVDVATGAQVWSGRFHRQTAELSALDSDIALAVARSLRPRRDRLTRPAAHLATPDAEAYELYLRGRYLANRRTQEALSRAAALFREAVDRQPGFALAWAGLADTYLLLSDYAGYSSAEMLDRAEQAALTAVRLDEGLAEAHASLALVHKGRDWNWTASERAFKRALELDPGYATAHHWYAIFLGAMGRFDEALAEIDQARVLDPVSLGVNIGRGYLLYWTRRYAEADEQCRQALELHPDFFGLLKLRGLIALARGRTQDGLADLERARRLAPDVPELDAVLGYAYACAGRHADARRVLRRLEERSRTAYVSPVDLAAVHARLGELDAAIAALERGYRERGEGMADIKVNPLLDPLRADPRFVALLGRMGLGE